MPAPGTLEDTLARPLRDLRVSVTDRCNFRCTYCMPKEIFGRDFEFLPHPSLLSFEEIARVARIAAGLGVTKVRITGGEPLLRRDLPALVSLLAGIDGIRDLALTTNGSALRRLAAPLRAAGLGRITVSLDSLRDEAFRAMNDVAFPVARVLDGIEAAAAAGFERIKVNMVVRRGVNEADVPEVAGRFRGTGITVRFIEYMDVGTTNGWRLQDVVSGDAILAAVGARWPLAPVPPDHPGEVASRWRYEDGAGEIGVITSVTRPFCAGCTRARLTADGQLYTCLFGAAGHDLRPLLRGGAPDAGIRDLFRRVWTAREDRYSEIRSAATAPARREEMHRLGG